MTAVVVAASSVASPPPATGTLTGQAFIQTSSGVPRTCAGQDDVHLVPEAAAGDIASRVGPSGRALLSVDQQPVAIPSGARAAACDATGAFRFSGLEPGTYLVTSTITWAGGRQGGTLVRRVVVAAGGATELILSAAIEDVPPPPAPPARDPREAVAEQRIRASLIDPGSAQFEWSGRWLEGIEFKMWRWSKPTHGDFSCGYVNARNRMGGFAGRSAFFVLITNGVVTQFQLDGTNTEPYLQIALLKCQSAGLL